MCFKNEKMQKLLNWFSILTLVTTTFMILVVGYWSLYPIVPAKISSIHVVQDKVEAGKPLTLEITYCKYVNITPNITTAFVDGVIFYLNDTQLTVPEGCGINNVVINVPQEMASGTYSIRRTWVYQVNPIRKISITINSNKFEIVGSDTDRQADQHAK